MITSELRRKIIIEADDDDDFLFLASWCINQVIMKHEDADDLFGVAEVLVPVRESLMDVRNAISEGRL
jgi:hypothetical protein